MLQSLIVIRLNINPSELLLLWTCFIYIHHSDVFSIWHGLFTVCITVLLSLPSDKYSNGLLLKIAHDT